MSSFYIHLANRPKNAEQSNHDFVQRLQLSVSQDDTGTCNCWQLPLPNVDSLTALYLHDSKGYQSPVHRNRWPVELPLLMLTC